MAHRIRTDLGSRCLATSAAVAAALAYGSLALAPAPSKAAAPAADVQVLTGGVGLEDRARLAEQGRGHNLKLVFTMTPGYFVGDVAFEILRGNTTIVKETSPGPWAFVKLPGGSYTVKATYEGRTQTRQVNVPGTGQTQLSFQWPASSPPAGKSAAKS